MEILETTTGTLLRPADGCLLTDGETYATEVKLAPSAKASDWHEIAENEIPSLAEPEIIDAEPDTIEEQAPHFSWGQNIN